MTEIATEVEDFEPEALSDDEVELPVQAEGESKEAKAPKAPKRGELPEGKITPVQFAHELSEPKDGNKDNEDDDNWHYTNSKTGSHVVAPQMVYSYLKSAPEGQTAISSQPCGVTVARLPGRSSTVVIADSTMAGPAIA